MRGICIKFLRRLSSHRIVFSLKLFACFHFRSHIFTLFTCPANFFILWDEFSVEKGVIVGDFWPTDVNYNWVAKPSRNLRLISSERDDKAKFFLEFSKCVFIKDLKPTLNKQSDSIRLDQVIKDYCCLFF